MNSNKEVVMENFLPSLLLELLTISITFSVILMAVIQKLKSFNCINKPCQIMILNIVLSFIIGIPFGITFYNINWIQGMWVALFSFVGASSIYEALKKQNIINYHPSSNNISISKNNEIKRTK